MQDKWFTMFTLSASTLLCSKRWSVLRTFALFILRVFFFVIRLSLSLVSYNLLTHQFSAQIEFSTLYFPGWHIHIKCMNNLIGYKITEVSLVSDTNWHANLTCVQPKRITKYSFSLSMIHLKNIIFLFVVLLKSDVKRREFIQFAFVAVFMSTGYSRS